MIFNFFLCSHQENLDESFDIFHLCENLDNVGNFEIESLETENFEIPIQKTTEDQSKLSRKRRISNSSAESTGLSDEDDLFWTAIFDNISDIP